MPTDLKPFCSDFAVQMPQCCSLNAKESLLECLKIENSNVLDTKVEYFPLVPGVTSYLVHICLGCLRRFAAVSCL